MTTIRADGTAALPSPPSHCSARCAAVGRSTSPRAAERRPDVPDPSAILLRGEPPWPPRVDPRQCPLPTLRRPPTPTRRRAARQCGVCRHWVWRWTGHPRDGAWRLWACGARSNFPFPRLFTPLVWVSHLALRSLGAGRKRRLRRALLHSPPSDHTRRVPLLFF